MDLTPRTTTPPVFLLGFQRSGTTLLRLYLDAHSQLAIPFESFVLIEFWHRRSRYCGLATRSDRLRLVEDLLASKGISAWTPRVTTDDINIDECTTFPATVDQIFRAYARRCGKSVWGDKTPSYTADFHVLNELFPDARFVHLLRDGRDAALSLAGQPWGPSDFVSALSQWNEVVTWSRKMGRLMPAGRYLELRYEDLVSQPEQILRQVTEFLGLRFEVTMLEAHLKAEEKLPARSLAFHPNVTQPADSDQLYRWRHRLSAADQAIALKIAGEALAALGYSTDRVPVSAARVQTRILWHYGRAAFRWRIRRVLKALGLKRRHPAASRDRGSAARPRIAS